MQNLSTKIKDGYNLILQAPTGISSPSVGTKQYDVNKGGLKQRKLMRDKWAGEIELIRSFSKKMFDKHRTGFNTFYVSRRVLKTNSERIPGCTGGHSPPVSLVN